MEILLFDDIMGIVFALTRIFLLPLRRGKEIIRTRIEGRTATEIKAVPARSPMKNSGNSPLAKYSAAILSDG